jgi:phage terminase Nu1 subunit (DNA packaging protein)
MLRTIDGAPDLLPAGATMRVEEYRNESLRWKKACAETAKGAVYRKRGGEPGLNPYIRVERDAGAQMRRIEATIRRELRDAQAQTPPRGGTKAAVALIVNRTDAERILGVPQRTFARLEAEGVVIPSRRGKPGVPSEYDLATIVPAYIDHLKASIGKNGDRQSRARRDQSQAELNELRLAERRKELLLREDVVREGQSFVKASQAKILSLPRRLVQAGHIPPETQQEVAGLLREALEEMARWNTELDLLRAAKERR